MNFDANSSEGENNRRTVGSVDSGEPGHRHGLPWAQSWGSADVARHLRPSGAEIHIAKNTLTRIAAGNAGVVGLDPIAEGPSALVFSFEDAVQTAKAVSDFVRTSRILSVKGGVMGDRTVTAADVEAIATLPSREELQARLLGMLVSPMARTLSVLSGPSRSMVYLLNARAEQPELAQAAS